MEMKLKMSDQCFFSFVVIVDALAGGHLHSLPGVFSIVAIIGALPDSDFHSIPKVFFSFVLYNYGCIVQGAIFIVYLKCVC